MPTIVNQNNFLRWTDVNNIGPSDDTAPIGNGYIQDSARCDYTPIFQHSEANRFYINSILGTYWLVDTNIVLQLVNAVTGAVQNASVASLQKDEFTNSAGTDSFNYYAEVTLANTTPGGLYFLRIKGDTRTWLESNNILVVAATDTDRLRGTSLVTYRHDRYFYGIRYNAQATFTHQYRIHLNYIDQQEESTVDVYKEVTTGARREYNTSMDQVWIVETIDFDKDAHSAAMVMFKHSDFKINGRSYIAKDSYRVGGNPRNKGNKGSISLYDCDFASVTFCAP